MNISHGGGQETLREVYSGRLLFPEDVTIDQENQHPPMRSMKRYLNEETSNRSDRLFKRYH